MQTIAMITIATGLDSVQIKDITKGWTFSMTETQTPNTKQSVYGVLDLSGSGSSASPLPHFTTIKTSGDTLTLGSHHGSIGSFTSDSSVTVYRVRVCRLFHDAHSC